VRAALPHFSDEQILGEPEGRDTVNAVGLTAAILLQRDAEAVFAVLTADHLIEPLDEFRDKLEVGFQLVERDPKRLVTFSITPTSPATGYGYVERGEAIGEFAGAFHARRFVEKPDLETAQQYLRAGTFGWNSGMFVLGAAQFMQCLAWYKPQSREGLEKIAAAWGTPERRRVLQQVYPSLPKVSIDFAVMEPASKPDQSGRVQVCTVPMNVTWIDVGSWPSYGQTLPPDGRGNRASGASLHLDSRGVLSVCDDPNHLIATIGCEDLIIIHTRDATLVCPASQAERVKELAGKAPPALQ
jgi:mannose-1-phosphate guanylyltransferase